MQIRNRKITITKTTVVKVAAGLVVGAGAGYIARAIIANNIQPEGIVTKTTTALATVVIALMAKKATKDFTSDLIDELIDAWQTGMEAGVEIVNELNPDVCYIEL